MNKTDKMNWLEKDRKKDIREILVSSYEVNGLLGSAVDLGVSPQTLYRWYKLLGIEREVTRSAR